MCLIISSYATPRVWKIYQLIHSFRKVSKKSVLERMMNNKLQIGELSVPDRAVNEPSRSFHIHGEGPYYTRALMKASSRALTFQNLLRLIFLPIDKKFLKIPWFWNFAKVHLQLLFQIHTQTGRDLFVFPRPPEQRRCPGPHLETFSRQGSEAPTWQGWSNKYIPMNFT